MLNYISACKTGAIRRSIEVVITSSTRNRVGGNTPRGFESHLLRQTRNRSAALPKGSRAGRFCCVFGEYKNGAAAGLRRFCFVFSLELSLSSLFVFVRGNMERKKECAGKRKRPAHAGLFRKGCIRAVPQCSSTHRGTALTLARFGYQRRARISLEDWRLHRGA